MGNPIVQAAQFADLQDIALLEQQCFADPWSHSLLLESWQQPNTHFFVAKIQNEVVGYVGVMTVLESADLLNLAVAEKYRRQGIAVALLQQVESFLQQLKVEVLHLEVRNSNVAAITLYERLGFCRIAQRPRYYADGETAAIYEKAIQSMI